MTSSARMMTRPLRAFSLRISSTVPRLELDTGRPARHVRDLEYHTGEHGFLPVSLSSLTSYSDDTAPKFDGCPVGGAQSIKGSTAIGRLTGFQIFSSYGTSHPGFATIGARVGG